MKLTKTKLRQIIKEEINSYELMESKKPGLSPSARKTVINMFKKELDVSDAKAKISDDRFGHIFTAKGSKNGLYIGEGFEDGKVFFHIYTIDRRGYPENHFWEKGKFSNLEANDVTDEDTALKVVQDMIRNYKKFLLS